MRRLTGFALVVLILTGLPACSHLNEPGLVPVGAAKVDITPDYPIRLSGYGSRRDETTTIEQRIFAKALALGSGDKTTVLLSVDATGVPAELTEEVASRLARKAGVRRERFALCVTHTHSAPCLKGYLTTLFGQPMPADHQAHVDRYTQEFADKLEQAALAALRNRSAGRLAFGQGAVRFGANRRTPGGPSDNAVPMLRVTDPEGNLRAVVFNYACHCTTMTGEFNTICGDWAGFAQENVERAHPEAVALAVIGCGGDQNPHPRPGIDLARRHGREMSDEVLRLVNAPLTPIEALPRCQLRWIELPFDPAPERAEWEERAKRQDAIGYHARVQLEKLDRGQALPTVLHYPIQTWTFDDDLAMVLLAGEVVIDYTLRLKREFDSNRLWVTAYSNDVPCYIPSVRILDEGGYEAEGAMTYYDMPGRLAPVVEERIVATVHELLPATFRAPASQPAGVAMQPE